MSKRIKAPSIETRAEFERVVDDIAQSTVALRKLEARRDEQIQKVRSEWDPACAQQQERIKALGLLAEKYAEEHREEIFAGKAKSAETPLAMFGFRTGMPSLKLLSKWSWEKVLQMLETFQMNGLIRTKLEVDKEAIIRSEREGVIEGSRVGGIPLGEIGVRVVQSETFFVEPKDKPAKETAAA